MDIIETVVNTKVREQEHMEKSELEKKTEQLKRENEAKERELERQNKEIAELLKKIKNVNN